MEKFDHIVFIYNPNSTGEAPKLAKQARQQFKDNDLAAVLVPTKHAGHAVKLAEEISLQYVRPLIVSVSGDGGYNEVINGVMNAKNKQKSANPVVAVVAAGNANDHRRVTRDSTPLLELVLTKKARAIDILQMTIIANSSKTVRYAHSYIGLGVTPAVAAELNKHELNFIKEIMVVISSFSGYKPFEISHESKTKVLDSLIFANINEMAKVLKLNEANNIQDNRFEVIEFVHKGRVWLLLSLLKAAVIGLKNQPSYKSYDCSLKVSQPIQADGEVLQLPHEAKLSIKSIAQAVDCLY